MKALNFFSIAAIFFVTLFSSCKKDELMVEPPLLQENSEFIVHSIYVNEEEQIHHLFDGVYGVPVVASFEEEVTGASLIYLQELWDGAFEGDHVPPSITSLGRNFTWTYIAHQQVSLRFKIDEDFNGSNIDSDDKIYEVMNGSYRLQKIINGIMMVHTKNNVQIILKE